MSKKEIPCINCITLPICRNSIQFINGIPYIADLYLKCSIIYEYTTSIREGRKCWNWVKRDQVINFLVNGDKNENTMY